MKPSMGERSLLPIIAPLLIYCYLIWNNSVQALPPPNDTPEEVLRTEVLTEARSPLNGESLSAAEYAELQVALRSTEAVQPKVSPKIRRLITLLRLRKGIRRIFPFLLR